MLRWKSESYGYLKKYDKVMMSDDDDNDNNDDDDLSLRNGW